MHFIQTTKHTKYLTLWWTHVSMLSLFHSVKTVHKPNDINDLQLQLLLNNAFGQSKVHGVHNAMDKNALNQTLPQTIMILWYLCLPLLHIMPRIKDQDSCRRIVCLLFFLKNTHCWDVTKRAIFLFLCLSIYICSLSNSLSPPVETWQRELTVHIDKLLQMLFAGTVRHDLLWHTLTQIYIAHFSLLLLLFQMPFTGTGVASVVWFDSTK